MPVSLKVIQEIIGFAREDYGQANAERRLREWAEATRSLQRREEYLAAADWLRDHPEVT